MHKEMDFFIFLIEQYAAANNTTADQVLQMWDEAGATNTIYDMYERYHSESIENAFEGIDEMMKTGG